MRPNSGGEEAQQATRPITRFAWLAALAVFTIFTVLLFGASVARELFAVPVVGWFSVGHLLALLVHVLPPLVAIVFLMRTQKQDQQ